MASKVAFGFIPVPVEETTKILTGTPLTELLAKHITDFVQLSSFADGLNYSFFANTPLKEYEVRDALWVYSLGKNKRLEEVDKTKFYTIIPVILNQGNISLGFHHLKPLNQTTWSDIDELLTHMNFLSSRKLSKWKSKYDMPKEWVFDELSNPTESFF